MKKYITFKATSFYFKLLKRKVEYNLTVFNENGYQVESVKYLRIRWLFPTVECVLFKIGIPCVCPCHHSNEIMKHVKPYCENGYIFN